MAGDDKRRQKKLERHNAKRKERRRTLVKEKNRGLAEQLTAAAAAPVLDCLVAETLWDEGMGHAVISRQLPNGTVAFGVFLLDVYCLGVKDAFGNVLPRGEYRTMLEDLEGRFDFVEMPPEDFRCLVEDAVQFARDLGLEPHASYRRVKPIFGDIDPQAATKRFQFGGENGKPHFIAGPYDDPRRCYQILSTLEQSCGEGGFDYTLPILEGPGRGLGGRFPALLEDDEDEFEDDD